jgi:hypothetical protein
MSKAADAALIGWAAIALMLPLRPRDGLPDFGAAVRAFIDEVDRRQAPMGLDVSHIHGKQSHAAGADDRNSLDFVMLYVGWHIGSPSQQKHVNLNPARIYRRGAVADHQLFRT